MNFPATFVKAPRGDQPGQTRVVRTPAEAVKAKFDGFALVAESEPEHIDYRELQAEAKRRGISANQSAAALIEAIAATPVLLEPPTTDADGAPVDDQA